MEFNPRWLLLKPVLSLQMFHILDKKQGSFNQVIAAGSAKK